MTHVSYYHEVTKEIEAGMARNVKTATALLHAALVVKLTSGNRSGKTYKVPGTQRDYRASAPGEPPAMRTGVTAGSYDIDVEPTRGRVGSPMPTARDLERGTSKMAPRPHLKPSLDETLPAIKSALSKPL
jgi:hypothetical protein